MQHVVTVCVSVATELLHRNSRELNLIWIWGSLRTRPGALLFHPVHTWVRSSRGMFLA